MKVISTVPSMYQKLIAREKPILVSVVGAGEFGRQVVTQISYVPNMEIVGVADHDLETAVSALLMSGYKEDEICRAETLEEAKQAVENGKKVAVRDAMMLCELPADALCDCTGSPPFGAKFAYEGIIQKKHLIVINIESTVSVGCALSRIAQENGVVYTTADGDQPSLIAGLYEWAKCLGMEVDVAGKWTSIKTNAESDLTQKRTKIGYADGSKNQVEMCCVANITGLVPDVKGMHCPSLTFDQILSTFDLEEKGGILKKHGVVDAINCLDSENRFIVPKELRGGVFVIASCENRDFSSAARTKHIVTNADGSRVLLYRPYHFVGIETPMSIIRAVMYGEATGAPLPTPVADVYAVAKRDLQAGETLDGIGGATVRGEMEVCTPEKIATRIPLALAENVVLKKPVREGEDLTFDMIEEPNDSFIWKLYKYQIGEGTL